MNAIKEARYNLGMAYLNDSQNNEAIHEFEAVIELDADFIDAHCGLSRAYLELNELEKAETSALAALSVDPDYSVALSLIDAVKDSRYDNGIIYLNDERYSDAVAAFQNVVTLDPDFTAAHFNLGVAYLKMETYTRAVEALQKTITLDRTHKAAYHALALAYFGQHELEKARNAAKDALKIDSNYQPAESLLEAIDPNFSHLPISPTTETQDAATQPEIDTAEDPLVEESEQARPTDNESQSAEKEKDSQEDSDVKKDLDRGIIFLNNRQYQQAAAAYKKVIKAEPNCVDAHYGLGETCLEIGAFDDAKTSAEAALKLDPYHQSSHELLQTIKYFVNLDRNQKIRKKVLLYASIVAVIAFGVFVAYRFGWFPPPPPPPPPIPPKLLLPKLSIKPSLEEPSGNGFIDAGETVRLKLKISNRGEIAKNVKVQLKPASISGLRFKIPTETFNLSKDGSKTVEIEIKADKKAQARDTYLEVQLIGEDGSPLKTEKFDFKIMREGPEPDPVR